MIMASTKSASPSSPVPSTGFETAHTLPRTKSPFTSPQDDSLEHVGSFESKTNWTSNSVPGSCGELRLPGETGKQTETFSEKAGQEPSFRDVPHNTASFAEFCRNTSGLNARARKPSSSDLALTNHSETSGPENSADTDLESHTLPIKCKSKRSSSASNDAFLERDRFRARFKTFNSPADAQAPSGDAASSSENANLLDSSGEPLSVVCEFDDILSKTKKLDLKPSAVSDTASDYLSDWGHVSLDLGRPARSRSEATPSCEAKSVELKYPRRESVSPLAKESRIFCHFAPIEDAQLDLRSISVAELSEIFVWYFNKSLPPTCQMFPWLHGMHAENFAQRAFFARSAKGSDLSEKPSSARFIMCVETNSAKPQLPRVVRNSVSIDELLYKVEYSKAEVIEKSTAVVKSLQLVKDLQKSANETAINDDLVQTLVSDSLSTGFMPHFLETDPERGISLRNFHIQVNKVARCADFVVYCADPHHETCKCKSVGRLLRVAQLLERTQSQARCSEFNVFVLNWNKSHLEEYPDVFTVRDCSAIFSGQNGVKKTQLLLYSMILLRSDTFSSWDGDFQVKEKVENIKMSAATRLHLNVWLGNVWDHQIMQHLLRGSLGLYSEFSPEIRACTQKHIYCDPENSSLAKSCSWGPKLVSSLPPPRSNWQLFFHCHNDALFPNQSLLADLLFKYAITSRKAAEVSEVHHLEFPSSGSVGLGDCRQENLMSIVNSCKLLYLYLSSVAEGSLASLIYCSDGYTELSLLVLCYIMYAENIPLEQAILKLHLHYGRPYYIFNADVEVLRKLENLLRRYSPARLGACGVEWARLETITSQEISDILLYSPGCVGIKHIPRKLKLGYIASDSDSSTDSELDEDESTYAAMADRKWVEDVGGSLPSRILPYLYLGSLKHANNPVLLSKLGITTVVSVGENLDWLHGYKFQENNTTVHEQLLGGHIEKIDIVPKKALKLTVRSVMKIKNLQDDGIDELSRSLPYALDFIDQEYQRNKDQARILVHCRVGVSRSATVVIAEVMRRLNMNLPQAYLYVRVRRLNIVIQPNLRFMYELFKWEERMRENHMRETSRGNLRVVDWFVMCQEIKKLNMPFVRN